MKPPVGMGMRVEREVLSWKFCATAFQAVMLWRLLSFDVTHGLCMHEPDNGGMSRNLWP